MTTAHSRDEGTQRLDSERVERRLTAVLAADVAGYSRLMGADEEGTLAQLKAHRRELVDPKIAEHRGRIVKTTGDGMLVEFASVVDAVRCAVEVQRGMRERNAELPEDKRIEFRVGIHQGDIIIDGADIFGDGVNIAARLEGLAEPGGICVSGRVQEDASGKLDVAFEDAGEQPLKNIERPVRVYRVRTSGAPKATQSPLPLPDKASIAVLPFQNMSGDPEQEYFADGIVEDIITALSRFRNLFVIARNSSFTYKGRAVDVKQVGRELGVRYVLEGSVRKAGNRVRVTAQLIEVTAGTHVWAERYDRNLDDIFEIQDEISGRIVASVGPQFLNAETQRALVKRETDLNSWEQVLRARWHLGKYTREENAIAQALLAEATERSPAMAQAYSVLALAHLYALLWSWSDADEASAGAVAAAQQALALDGEDAVAHAVVGLTLAFARRYDEGFASLRRAIALNPNLADAHGYLGVIHALVGEYDACLKSIELACRLSPYDGGKAMWLAGKGIGAFVAGRYDDVIATASDLLREHPTYATAYRQRAAALAVLGRMEEARADVATLLRLVPGVTISQVRKRVPVREREAMERWLDALRTAGLPE